MVQFPSIEPLERSYGLGSHPISVARFNNGDETRFLHGSIAVGVPVSLSFPALTLTQARQISGHWDICGTIRPFTIPPHLWRMHSNRYDVVPVAFAWRYTAAPDENPLDGGLFDVTISITAV